MALKWYRKSSENGINRGSLLIRFPMPLIWKYACSPTPEAVIGLHDYFNFLNIYKNKQEKQRTPNTKQNYFIDLNLVKYSGKRNVCAILRGRLRGA